VADGDCGRVRARVPDAAGRGAGNRDAGPPGYFAVEEQISGTGDRRSAVSGQQGKLAAHFLAVLNTETDAKGEAVIRHGNERVLRARFNDARFFWEFDQRISLFDRSTCWRK